jgi:VanZ family protein
MFLPSRLPRPLRAAVYLACVGVLLWLSLAPQSELPKANLSDKFEHTVAYMVLTAAGLSLFPRHPRAIIGGAFAFGVMIEVLQAAMGFGRQGDWRDVAANSLGIVLVATPVLLWRRWAAVRP